MNSSKKTIKGPQKQETKKKEQKKINPKILLFISILLGVILAGAILFDQLYKRPILKIDDEKYYLDDLRYYFYTVEASYDYINQMYGGNYWDMPANEAGTVTVRDTAKQEAINTALYSEIIYKEALANNYTLTSEETDKVSTEVTSLLYDQGLSEKMLKENGFTGDYLTEALTKTTLAKRYKQDVIDAQDIDDEAIKSQFKLEDYRQYDIEYLFISTQTQDTAGKSIAMNEEEKKAAYDKLKAQYDKAKATEDWSTLVPEGEEQLKYQKTNFLESDTFFEDEFEAMMIGMENNEISDIYETADGYYLVRMINNNSTETFDRTVEESITKAEEEAFQAVYNEDILPKYDYKTNVSAIRSLRMGTITLID